MKHLITASALSFAVIGGPLHADQLPETMASEIEVLMPGANVSDREFTATEIDELGTALSSSDSAADKRRAVEEVLARTTTDPTVVVQPLPDTLASDIQTLMPDANIDGRLFTSTEIDELGSAVYSEDSPATKVQQVQEILDVSMSTDGVTTVDTLPDTLAGDIQTLIPDVDLSGRVFTETQIDQLRSAMTSTDSPAVKRQLVEEILGM